VRLGVDLGVGNLARRTVALVPGPSARSERRAIERDRAAAGRPGIEQLQQGRAHQRDLFGQAAGQCAQAALKGAPGGQCAMFTQRLAHRRQRRFVQHCNQRVDGWEMAHNHHDERLEKQTL
jgi:hypothetical protein